ncbi:class 1 fructose-bisphosphatase [Povalibacter sp.]|uniref:class 1 fructose-bisphosphatase n=1 Tax=Povalibacter sp. TaxID=1962978 RepID=UPI0032C22846
MYSGRTTLSKFLIEHCHAEQRELAALLIDVAAAVKAISSVAGKGVLGGGHGMVGGVNVQGEEQHGLDVLADEIFVDHCEWSGQIAGMLSEENENPLDIPLEIQRGSHLLVFDPLDGSSNIEINVCVGTIFSVLRYEGSGQPQPADYLQCGTNQVAAGYALYGPSTMFVLTIGKGTHGFTLDREIGNFILTHPNLSIDPDASEFAINISNERFWEAPIKRYVSECKAGATGVRTRDFNMRWIASMVADVHRILMRGGVYLYPYGTKDPQRAGRLRLLYEANPVAFLVEQAGGAASTGLRRMMEVVPDSLHQRVPLIFGSRNEVERIERYHVEHAAGIDKPYYSPLFAERSLLRIDA